MTGEPDNFAPAETDNANPISETDNPETLDYYDPDEDNVETEVATGTDDETQEAEAEVQEIPEGEVEADPNAEDGEQTTEAPSLDTLYEVNGKQVSAKDLIAGNMRQEDYSRKTQEASNLRKTIEAEATRIESISNALVEHLTTMVPAEPNPQLALTDPNAYTAQKAQFEAAMAQVEKLVEIGSQPKEVLSKMSQEQHQSKINEENQRLAMVLPETATPDGRKEFFGDVASVAEKIGFSRDDVKSIDDHRIFVLAHWAKKGMDAESAKASAQEKVQKAAPATVRKPGQPARQANRNVDAMRKLSKSGSIHDALAVDFE